MNGVRETAEKQRKKQQHRQTDREKKTTQKNRSFFKFYS